MLIMSDSAGIKWKLSLAQSADMIMMTCNISLRILFKKEGLLWNAMASINKL